MGEMQGAAGLGMHMVDGVLVVQAPDDFDDAAMLALKRAVLAKVHAMSARGVVIDVSTLRLLDSVGFTVLADTARASAMLGARAVFVGFQPGVVSALLDLDVASEDILAARDLAHGMALLRPPAAPAEPDDEEPEDAAGAAGADGAEAEDAGEDGANPAPDAAPLPPGDRHEPDED